MQTNFDSTAQTWGHLFYLMIFTDFENANHATHGLTIQGTMIHPVAGITAIETYDCIAVRWHLHSVLLDGIIIV